VILAADHLAVADSFYVVLAARRPVTFLAKREYFDGTGVAGTLRRWFFSWVGQIPVDRRGGASASPARAAATRILEGGGVWGIHPEGTRSPDGRLYRGRTGAVRVALATGAPLVPIALSGTRREPGSPWWRRRVVLEILEPMDLEPYRRAGSAGVRAATDALMRRIGEHTGQVRVDGYASRHPSAATWAAERPLGRVDGRLGRRRSLRVDERIDVGHEGQVADPVGGVAARADRDRCRVGAVHHHRARRPQLPGEFVARVSARFVHCEFVEPVTGVGGDHRGEPDSEDTGR